MSDTPTESHNEEEEPQARATRYAWEILDLKTDIADERRKVTELEVLARRLRSALNDVLASDPHNCSNPDCYHCIVVNSAYNYLGEQP